MKTSEINIRDPFVLPYEGKYYMYGTRKAAGKGFDVYISEDLENWSDPVSIFEYYEGFWGKEDFWAPEVHLYQGRFYMLASFIAAGKMRGTAILVSDAPTGPFREHSDGAVTPEDWMCLDGTLYVSPEGTPYMVFCHEWVQIGNGTVCAVELSGDLKRPVSEPVVLWQAGDAVWAHSLPGSHKENYVTDGPYLIRSGKQLAALWSSFNENGYVEAVARSKEGTIHGTWTIDEKVIYDGDGGHGMVFQTREGKNMFVCHAPNTHLKERPVFREIDLSAVFPQEE